MIHPLDPPKPCLSNASWSLISEYPMDAEEILAAFKAGFDVLIQPKIGLVATCALTSLTKELCSNHNFIVIEADSGLTIHP